MLIYLMFLGFLFEKYLKSVEFLFLFLFFKSRIKMGIFRIFFEV